MRPPDWPKASPALISAGAVSMIGAAIALCCNLGPQAQHMALHIIAMNIVAPVIAGTVVARWSLRDAKPSTLWVATVVQIAAVWALHAPSVQAAAMVFPVIQIPVHLMLLVTALAFWTLLLSLSEAKRWHALPALLLTGKLVCLLAALLVFAPRALYGVHHQPSATMPALHDQQLAGLLMIAACPLSYLMAALVITVRFLKRDRAAGEALWPQPARRAG